MVLLCFAAVAAVAAADVCVAIIMLALLLQM